MFTVWEKLSIWSVKIPADYSIDEDFSKNLSFSAYIFYNSIIDEYKYIQIKRENIRISDFPIFDKISNILFQSPSRSVYLKNIIDLATSGGISEYLKMSSKYLKPSFIVMLNNGEYDINSPIYYTGRITTYQPAVETIMIKLCLRDIISTDSRIIYDFMIKSFKNMVETINKKAKNNDTSGIKYLANYNNFTKLEAIILLECVPEELILKLREINSAWCA